MVQSEGIVCVCLSLPIPALAPCLWLLDVISIRCTAQNWARSSVGLMVHIRVNNGLRWWRRWWWGSANDRDMQTAFKMGFIWAQDRETAADGLATEKIDDEDSANGTYTRWLHWGLLVGHRQEWWATLYWAVDDDGAEPSDPDDNIHTFIARSRVTRPREYYYHSIWINGSFLLCLFSRFFCCRNRRHRGHRIPSVVKLTRLIFKYQWRQSRKWNAHLNIE